MMRLPRAILLSTGLLVILSGCVAETAPTTRTPGDNVPALAAGGAAGRSLWGAEVSLSLGRGARALVARQHADDGSWGGDDVKEPGPHKSDYPVAISSLAYLALTAAAPDDSKAASARARALRFVLDTIEDSGTMKNTRDNTPKVHERNVWSQAFSLFVLGRTLCSGDVPAELRKEVRAEMGAMVAALGKTQQTDGGWTYDKGPSESFTTATVLMGLVSAREASIPVPAGMIAAPMAYLKRQSNPGHYVSYQGVPKTLDTRGRVRDSIGRSVQLELALLQGGAGLNDRLRKAVETFFAYRERMDKVRDLEKGCHQRPYMIGTFYCFYGYFYLAQAVEYLGGETQAKYRPALVSHFLALQKPDGHWIDSKDHCGESYGTAMGLLVLTAPTWANTAR